MERPAVSLVLVVVLGLTATLPGPTMVLAEGSSAAGEQTTTSNMTREDSQCSPLQRRQDLLDNQMNGRETRLNSLDTRLNEVNTHLNIRHKEVNTRLDDLDTAMSDMKEYLQTQMAAMGQKVEWALSGVNPQGQKDQQPTANPEDSRPPTTSSRPPTTSPVLQGCEYARRHGLTASGVYSISLENNKTIDVYCDQLIDGGGWTVFQARKDGSVDFFRDWNAYEAGFGNLLGEFWLGNKNIHLLTKHHDHQLKVELVFNGEVKFANYAYFRITDATDKFRLSVSGYSGGDPPGDCLTYHSGRQFTTRDEDNDSHSSENCATYYVGAWWYVGCHHSNLNGQYGGRDYKGMAWQDWKGGLSMSATRMMMRRRP